jgi:hypothetical protein
MFVPTTPVTRAIVPERLVLSSSQDDFDSQMTPLLAAGYKVKSITVAGAGSGSDYNGNKIRWQFVAVLTKE